MNFSIKIFFNIYYDFFKMIIVYWNSNTNCYEQQGYNNIYICISIVSFIQRGT